MLAAVGDLLTNRMNPVESIQDQNGVSRQRMRRSGDTNLTLGSLGDAGEAYGSSGEVKGEIFEPLGFIVKDELVSMNGKPGRVPFQQFIHERLREALGTMETFQE